MTLEAIKQLSDKELVAELGRRAFGLSSAQARFSLPDPLSIVDWLEDHCLSHEERRAYYKVLGRSPFHWLWHAPSRKRAEAWLFIHLGGQPS